MLSVVLAALGYSFMAPIMGTLVGNAVVVVLLVVRWGDLRVFLPSFGGYRDVIGFGAYSTSTVIINVFYNMAPQFILARVLDFTAVGLYGRAINVTQVFERFVTQVVNPVIMPAIFAQIRTGGDLKRIYLNAIELISAVQWPFLITFALMADQIILLWFGPTWTEIIPLIRLLCLASLSLFAACLTYPVLVAAGRIRDTLTSSLISLPPSLLVVFVSSFFGVQAVAASALLTLPFQAGVALYFVSKHLAISPADLYRATVKSGVVTFCSTIGVLLSTVMAEFGLDRPDCTVAARRLFCSSRLDFGIDREQASAVGSNAPGSEGNCRCCAVVACSWPMGVPSGREGVLAECAGELIVETRRY